MLNIPCVKTTDSWKDFEYSGGSTLTILALRKKLPPPLYIKKITFSLEKFEGCRLKEHSAFSINISIHL